MRLPTSAHTSRPWRVHEITQDFEVEDVWELPTPGGPDDLARLVQWFTSRGDDDLPIVLRALFALRWKLGGAVQVGQTRLRRRRTRALAACAATRGSARSAAWTGCAHGSRARGRRRAGGVQLALPDARRVGGRAFQQDRARRDAPRLGSGRSGSGYHGQMAVLVKPNGRFGRAYMAAIRPFRHALVYPLLLRAIGRGWSTRAGGRAA